MPVDADQVSAGFLPGRANPVNIGYEPLKMIGTYYELEIGKMQLDDVSQLAIVSTSLFLCSLESHRHFTRYMF